jgi:AcrR family transcriptional regulator
MREKRSKSGSRRHAKAGAAAPLEPRRRHGGRSARVRGSVLQSAFAVLIEKGFEAFTIADVAQRADVHETSIYRRWGGRTALAMEACLYFAEDALEIPDTGSLRSDLVCLLQRLVALLISPQGRALLALSVSQDSDAIATRRGYWRTRFSLARSMLERAVSRGEFPHQVDPTIFLEALIAPLYMRALVTAEPLQDWPCEEMVDRWLASYAKEKNETASIERAGGGVKSVRKGQVAK